MTIVGDRWWPQTAEEEGDKMSDAFFFNVIDGRNVMNTQNLDVSLFGSGTVLRLEREAWSVVK